MNTKRPLSAVLAMLVSFLWTTDNAWAHPYWPTDIKVEKEGENVFISFRVIKPPPKDGEGQHVQDIGLNWCNMKWLVQRKDVDGKREILRTGNGELCGDPPRYASRGKNYKTGLWHQNVVGNHKIQLDADHRMGGGFQVISVNFWTGSIVHHDDGSHTTLKLVENKW